MDSRSLAFLEIMAAIGVVGLVAFLIFLVSRQALRAQTSASTAGATGPRSAVTPQWYELLLAAAAVLVIVALFLWQFSPWSGAAAGSEAAAKDGRAWTFFIVMLVIAAAGLIVFLATMLWRAAQPVHRASTFAHPSAASPTGSAALTPAATAAPRAAETAHHETPSAVRLVGLLAFGVAYLILNWSYVPHAQQYAMMLNLIYPAGFIIALVMMFDKASRAWHIKLPGETAREWLFCNLVLLLYLIGYLNLLTGVAEKTPYSAMFWDFLHVAGFLLVLWVLDRKTSRLRFLFAHAYLVLLPVLLLIWRNSQEIAALPDASWWASVWPFFFLALVFLVVELIVLIANRDNASQGAGTAKDIIFLILYVIILIAARP